MTCSRQHFELIARVVRDADLTNRNRAQLAQAFADELVRTNPRFDRRRFMRRCTEAK